ncbi:uncharacterized protein PHACADRAFT_249269 [Phanerochaete carnosa HHB-10118-sp]|uniref:Uncharacterized protein n=1 Tax=Phanerochaete carnosa (strain HHB-10118-sp) TaxID=650164 RepID=K5V8E2_PHACS|nr:uncharacterized protein PHACADRAFT_249269 [Phanerochaete carnosa HHB-10118-sp]EKM59076.1 hypothetical protein PHACADRAFT_249269 [Phanerochaete carnosa HHB-10118-sp]
METDHIPVSPAHTQDMQLAEDVLGRLRQLEDTGVPPHADDPDSDRTAYLAQIGPLLRSFRAWTVPAADAALHLDYAPWLRHIVAVEEEQRAVFAQTEASGGSQRRRTRNSQRSEHSWLSLVAEERGLLATSGFST